MKLPVNGPFVVIGIDQSLTGTGLAVVRADFPRVEVVSASVVSSKQSGMDRIEEIVTSIKQAAAEHCPAAIAMEDYTRMASSASLSALIELAGCIKLNLFRIGLEPVIQNQSSMKKFSFGEGNTKKDSAYMLKVFDVTGLRFDDDNAADAYLHAWFLVNKIWILQGRLTIHEMKPKQRDTLMSMAQKVSGKTDAAFRKMSDAAKLEFLSTACGVSK